MVVHISLITIGGIAGILAGTLVLHPPRSMRLHKVLSLVIGLLVATVATFVSVPSGWHYWLELGSNVWFFVVVKSSSIYAVIYFAMAIFLVWERKNSRLGRLT